jgi:hypothetical protein
VHNTTLHSTKAFERIARPNDKLNDIESIQFDVCEFPNFDDVWHPK